MKAMSNEMKECLQNCLDCHKVCLGMAMNHCLEVGGDHLEPDHFRLMMDCALICQTSADFMIHGSPRHKLTCGACAQICEECAASCEAIGDMEECAETCRKCAVTCRAMSA